LTGCATTPAVLTDPEIVYQDKIIRQQVPANLLTDCQVTPLPDVGSQWTWFEVLELMKQKDAEQLTCNERFGFIEDWMSDDP